MTKTGGTQTGKGTSKFVCCECIDDSFLKRLVQQKREEERECNFCGAAARKGKSAAPLQVVVVKVKSLFGENKRVRPAERGPSPPRANGYRSSDDPQSALDILRGLRLTSNEGLLSYVAGLLERDFAAKWWTEMPDGDLPGIEAGLLLDGAWCKFADVVTYESRFNFLTSSKSPFDIGKVLSQIGDLAASQGLVRRIPKGDRVYRARVRGPADTWNPDDPKELGAPPRDKASAGRMNAAGIPYLYTAFDEETALDEDPMYFLAHFAARARHATRPRQRSSCAASCCMCRPAASIASATTGCWPTAAARSVWRWYESC